MAYVDPNSYNKYQNCDCDDSSSCDCNSADCGCCPIGTVEIKDSCGKHVACLLPSDAAQYVIDNVDIPEGFIKVFDGDTYIGLLTVSEYATYLSTIANIRTPGFNVLVDGNQQVSMAITSTVASATSPSSALFDRDGVEGDITATLSIPGVLGLTLNSVSYTVDSLGAVTTSTNNVLLEGSSTLLFTLDYDATATTVGTFNGVITFTGGGVSRYAKVTVTVS